MFSSLLLLAVAPKTDLLERLAFKQVSLRSIRVKQRAIIVKNKIYKFIILLFNINLEL